MKFSKGGKNPGFKKGRSGNPGGRPFVPADVRKAFQEHTEESLRVITDIMRNGKKYPSAVRLRAAEIVLDRAWGRPSQCIQASVDVDAPPGFWGLVNAVEGARPRAASVGQAD